MKLNGTRVFFSSMLLAFAGVVATTPAHAQPPTGSAQPATTAAPTTAAQPAPVAQPGTAPAAPAATGEVQTTVQTTTQTTTVTTPAAAPAPAPVKPAPAMRVERRVTAPVVGAIVIGGVGIITGGVLAALAAKDKSDYDKLADDPAQRASAQDSALARAANDKAVSGEKKAFAADIALGTGVLFGLAALVLYLLPDEVPAASASTTPAVLPSLGQRTAKSWVKSAVTGRLDF